MKEKMDHVRRKMEILRKNQKEMLEIKKKKNNTVTERNVFDKLISRLREEYLT